MNTILNYCLENINRINSNAQSGFEWKNTYDQDNLSKIKNLEGFYNKIPNSITRVDIIHLINEKKYFEAYVELMLWGLIGVRPKTSKLKKTEIATKVFSEDKTKVISIFDEVIQELNKNNLSKIEEIFVSLEPNGKNKIDEVDISYFTKILAFASQGARERKLDLLIYDKWTKLIHIYLVLESNDSAIWYSENSLNKLCVKTSNGKLQTNLIYTKAGQNWPAYLDYCKRLKNLSNQILIETNLQVSPMKLEEFLFGRSLNQKGSKSLSNPRFWIQQNFCENFTNQV